MLILSVVLVVAAAMGNATASVLQRKADREVPEDAAGASGLRLLWVLAHNPVWFAGIAAIIIGFGLQAGALATGPIALVQPILVLELAFTLLLAGLVFRTRLHTREWAAVAAMTVGLAVMQYSLQPSGGDPHAASLIAWVIGGVVTLGVAAGFVLLGYHTRPAQHSRRAAFLGLATGIGFGFTAVLLAAITSAYAHGGIIGVFTTWQTYLLIAVGPGFFFLLQKAMQAGSLVASQPSLTLANPIVAAVFGLVVFGERVRTGPWLVGAFLGAALIAAATVVLVRSPLLHDPTATTANPQSPSTRSSSTHRTSERESRT